MEFVITLGVGGWVLLIAGALIFGLVAQFVGRRTRAMNGSLTRSRRGSAHWLQASSSLACRRSVRSGTAWRSSRH